MKHLTLFLALFPFFANAQDADVAMILENAGSALPLDICQLTGTCTTISASKLGLSSADAGLILPNWAQWQIKKQVGTPDALSGYVKGLSDATIVDICAECDCCISVNVSSAIQQTLRDNADISARYFVVGQ